LGFFVKSAEGATVWNVVSSYRRAVVNAAEDRIPPKAA
jgi:hypothetical protein